MLAIAFLMIGAILLLLAGLAVEERRWLTAIYSAVLGAFAFAQYAQLIQT